MKTELLSGSEVRRLIGITAAVWMELIETKAVPKPVDVGGRLKWRRNDILEWIAEMKAVGMFDERNEMKEVPRGRSSSS